MDLLAVATGASAISGICFGIAGLLRARRADQRVEVSDQRAEITALWAENRAQRVDMKLMHTEVIKLRRHVEQCEATNTALTRQLAEALGRPQ